MLDLVPKKSNILARDIAWGLFHKLEDLEYAENLCLLSLTLQQMKTKLHYPAEEAENVDL